MYWNDTVESSGGSSFQTTRIFVVFGWQPGFGDRKRGFLWFGFMSFTKSTQVIC